MGRYSCRSAFSFGVVGRVILLWIAALIVSQGCAQTGGDQSQITKVVVMSQKPDDSGHAGANLRGAETRDEWDDGDSPVPVSSQDTIWGSRVAPITIVVFTDLECPFCERFLSTLELIKKAYGPQVIRVVLKHYPLEFHRHARLAAIAAATVRALGGDEASWAFVRLVSSSNRRIDEYRLSDWAREVGVDGAAFDNAFLGETYVGKVDADLGLGKRLGVSGTPHSFINGVRVTGAHPVEDVIEIIDAQLTLAEKLTKSGTAADRVYVEASTKNYEEPAKRPETMSTEDLTVRNVPIGSSPSRGPKDAIVTIVVFGDFECPFCKRLEPTLAQIMTEYQGKLRIVWKNYPMSFHEHATSAALFAIEARRQKGDRGFWEAHDALFQIEGRLDATEVKHLALNLKMNSREATNAVEKRRSVDIVESDIALARQLGVTGVPCSFVNGRRLSGALPVDRFRRLIDEQMAIAEALVRSGVPKKAVYDRVTGGQKPVDAAQ